MGKKERCRICYKMEIKIDKKEGKKKKYGKKEKRRKEKEKRGKGKYKKDVKILTVH